MDVTLRDVVAKALAHKYIKRTGAPGNYQYQYADDRQHDMFTPPDKVPAAETHLKPWQATAQATLREQLPSYSDEELVSRIKLSRRMEYVPGDLALLEDEAARRAKLKPRYTVGDARYAKGKKAISFPRGGGSWKTADMYALDELFGGSASRYWSNRERAYIVSPAQAAKFEALMAGTARKALTFDEVLSHSSKGQR